MKKRKKIVQPHSGYRYSLDPFLLADFMGETGGRRVIDLGTGNGILVLLAKMRRPDRFLMGLDIQRDSLLSANENLADFSGYALVQADIRQTNNIIRPASFDMALSNPPYRKALSGRVNPVREKAIARHELILTLEELIGAASHSLRDGGVFYIIHLAERCAELLHTLRKHSLAPKEIRFVYSKAAEDAFLILASAVKKGRNPSTVKPGLIIYGDDGEYSSELKRIYKSFGHEY